ncbi:MAG TPA: hypothetical protein VEQ59_22545, partial [Polyangiaceae bacterium]|nr:hypothetical protein [Polyangiaceae bacterium]
LETWHGLPGSLKRRQFGAYWRAQWARVTVLKAPGAIVVAGLLGVGLLAAAHAAYPLALRLWRPSGGFLARAKEASKACGSQRTGAFEGSYRIAYDSDAADPADSEPEGVGIVITRDRIVLGSMSYCLSKVIERKPQSLHAEAIVANTAERKRPLDFDASFAGVDAEDVAANFLYDVRLDRGGQLVSLRLAPVANPMSAATLKLRRQP